MRHLVSIIFSMCRFTNQSFNINISWWRHQMETFSALLALCAGNSPVTGEFPHKGQWRGALMFSLICVKINHWVNNREAGDFRRHRVHYDVIVMLRDFHRGRLDTSSVTQATDISVIANAQWKNQLKWFCCCQTFKYWWCNRSMQFQWCHGYVVNADGI